MILAPIKPTEPVATLAELESFTDGQERSLGPLVAIGNDGMSTVLTFDMDDPPPGSLVILRPTPGGHAAPVPGYRLVCQGNGIVGGQLTGVAAFRAEPGDAPVPVPPDGALGRSLAAELSAVLSFKEMIVASAAAHGLPASVVAGIGSHESGWGTSPLMHPSGPAGTGDAKPRQPRPPLRPGSMPTDGLGFGRGLMQIDWDSHEFARTGAWRDAKANIDYGCSVLSGDLRQFMAHGFGAAEALDATVAAYNAGHAGAADAISQRGLASVIARGTYAGDVLARAAFFEANGFGGTAAATVALASDRVSAASGPYTATGAPEQFIGQSVPDGQCVAYVRAACAAPASSTWRKGALVKGNNTIKRGTAIATFDADGRYGSHLDGSSHAAVYLGQNPDGLVVLDQWKVPTVQPVHQRTIFFGHHPAVNDGNQFFVVM